MNYTRIETCDRTWNVITGCDQKCFDGHCYAYQIIKRFEKTWGYDWTPTFHPERLDQPRKVKKPSLIFAISMGDWHCPSIYNLWIDRMLKAMRECPQHRFQLQTKFAKGIEVFDYPPNVWLGVSLCYKKDVERLDYLRKTNARIKYAYCEPLLELIEPDFEGIDWVVIGGLTGRKAFKAPIEWILDVIKRADKVGAKIFVKENLIPNNHLKEFPDEEWMINERRASRMDKR